MKGFNVVLAVLIFLLAATSAVFSFFLFEKRKQLIDSHTMMGERLAKSAEKLDEANACNLKDLITTDKLNHTNTAELPLLLQEYGKLTDSMVKNRDMLAASLVEVGQALENNGFEVSDFNQLATPDKLQSKLNELRIYAEKVSRNRNDVYKLIGNTANALGIGRIEPAALKVDNPENVYKPILDDIAKKKIRIANLENMIRDLAVNLEITKTISLDNIASDTETMKKQANDIIGARNKFKSDWQSKTAESDARQKAIEALTKEALGMKKEIAELKAKLDHIYTSIGVKDKKRVPLTDGCKESLEMLKTQNKGVVLQVNEKFGFVTVSLGTKTRVIEKFGKEDVVLDPKLPAKHLNGDPIVLTVARNMPSGKAEYINRIKITKLDANCSIGEPIDKDGGKEIKEGDVVYLSDSEIDKIMKGRK